MFGYLLLLVKVARYNGTMSSVAHVVRGRERIKSLKEELAEALNAQVELNRTTPLGKVECSIIKSAPIDIIPKGSGSQRSSLELTDEEVDMEIDKIIRKKSLEKEKRVSTELDKQIIYCNASTSSMKKHSPIILKESLSHSVSPLKSEMTECNKSDKTLDLKMDICDTVKQNGAEDQDSINNVDNVLSEDNVTEHSTVTDTEDLNVINDDNVDVNNEPSESNESNNTYSASQNRPISDRDSANHSPVDPLLASPSMCHFSDSHSEGSNDSGKGCSEAASPPPVNLNLVPSETGLRIHQFIIPQTLVGLLIGKHGSFVNQIKAKTGASVYVRRHPDSVKQKICAVEGTQNEIEAALDMIKDKFPEKRFPNFSIQEISAELYQRLAPLVPEFLQLQLVESVNNDTIMTCLVSAGHFFLQQPLHPTFPTLHALHRLMAATYQNPDVPSLPRPVKEGSICAAPTENNWYRAQVISTSEENDTSVVKLVDFGGYLTVDNDQLKQIRSDFMTLPFQATEALLAFVKPANNEAEWSSEALRIMAGLTAGQLLHAQVAGYDEAGLPLVHLYLTLNPQQVIFLNRELVERGLAEWEIPPDS
ncbi:unnamed protein product [Parnassius apollo]|uniref:(apollo) hypothetical protein n=1 Tax=Parnassius apollo TaxID=110799 RepID=A0A8S3X282_PARAO|nr:unnamed protein product [Parnassius apollo]